MQPQRLKNRPGTDIVRNPKEARKSPVCQLNLPARIQQKHPFDHAVEQSLLLRLNLEGGLLVGALNFFKLQLCRLLRLAKSSAPPKVQPHQASQGQDG